ncbi:hypothetical protein TSAR_002175 [Trichomalopsis sarcophagae]|uniref:Uncharacterized protein n=1 Tax=Trichomalopsis sarcophagae TaxID=543379 RepID=A0A232F918_9HYME|nr:hypothetical protein TSAR_002175 [Trichomalopsis sarcophagae]
MSKERKNREEMGKYRIKDRDSRHQSVVRVRLRSDAGARRIGARESPLDFNFGRGSELPLIVRPFGGRRARCFRLNNHSSNLDSTSPRTVARVSRPVIQGEKSERRK